MTEICIDSVCIDLVGRKQWNDHVTWNGGIEMTILIGQWKAQWPKRKRMWMDTRNTTSEAQMTKPLTDLNDHEGQLCIGILVYYIYRIVLIIMILLPFWVEGQCQLRLKYSEEETLLLKWPVMKKPDHEEEADDNTMTWLMVVFWQTVDPVKD